MSGDIISIRRVSEGVKAKHLPAVLLFIGFSKAFDSIQKKKKKQEIRLAQKTPDETVNVIILYTDTRLDLWHDHLMEI